MFDSEIFNLLFDGDYQEYWIKLKKTTVQFSLAILAGLLFSWLHLPVAWLLGPMLLGICSAVIEGSPQPLPIAFTNLGQGAIALVTAARFSWETVATAKTYALPLLLCIMITGSMSLANGYLLWRWADIDLATGFLGCIPGAGSSIVAMSEEMGADAIAVALLQSLRIFLVAFIVPIVTGLFFSIDSISQPTTTIKELNHQPIFLNLLVLAACGGVGMWGGGRWRFPSSMFFGPFFVGLIVFWLLPYQLQMPPFVFAGGLLLIGLSIGLKFDWQSASKLLKAVSIDIALVILLILICFGVGYEFHAVTHADIMTSILGSAPGGIEMMIATTMQLGGDAGLVLAMQMTRMLLILLISPWFAAFLLKSKEKKENG